jgi:hypothetical protein
MDHLRYYKLLCTISYKTGRARARTQAPHTHTQTHTHTHTLLYWALGIEYFQCYCKLFLVFAHALLRYYFVLFFQSFIVSYVADYM